MPVSLSGSGSACMDTHNPQADGLTGQCACMWHLGGRRDKQRGMAVGHGRHAHAGTAAWLRSPAPSTPLRASDVPGLTATMMSHHHRLVFLPGAESLGWDERL